MLNTYITKVSGIKYEIGNLVYLFYVMTPDNSSQRKYGP